MMEKFHYTNEAGEEIVLPRIGNLKGGLIRRNRDKAPMDFVFSIAEEVCDEATVAKIDDMDMWELEDLFEKWQETTGRVGESAGSST